MVSSTFKRNSLGFFKFRCHHKSRVFQSFDGLLRIAIIISFPLAITIGYFYLFPNFHPAVIDLKISNSSMLSKKCNLFEGSWTKDEIYPLYNASLCPFTERGFNCLANGRKDKDYLKWRWKPHNCDIPRFNASVILKKLSGKQIVFVGDSMSRTQWESMICLLMNGVDDKESVHEVNGNKITKQIRFLGVRFSLFNFTVKFYRSVFLVQPGSVPRGAPKRVRSTLRLDKLDGCSREWIDADVLVFNTGQWWTPRKLFDMGYYFQVGGSLKLGMSTSAALRTALGTWSSWLETMINTNRTSVFFRTFESSHWRGKTRRSCRVSRYPLFKTRGKERNPMTEIIKRVVNNMTVPVTLLHVTAMGVYRSDAHVGSWSDNPSVPDCSHWCLPGVPDMWNEILISYLQDKWND